MPLAAGMFWTTIVGLCGRYFPRNRATVRAPTSVTTPDAEPTIIRTVSPRNETSSCACTLPGPSRPAHATTAAAMARTRCIRQLDILSRLRLGSRVLDGSLERRDHIIGRGYQPIHNCLHVVARNRLDRQAAP